jgi:putative heme-binding domain-containing protein
MLTLGSFKGREALDAIASILAKHPTDLFRAAAVAVLEGSEFDLLLRLILKDQWTSEHERTSGAVEVLSMAIANEGRPARMEALCDLAFASNPENPWFGEAIVAGFAVSEMARTRWPTPVALSREPPLLKRFAANEDTAKQAALLRKIVTWPGDTTPRPKRPVLEPLTAAQEKRRAIGEAVYGATCFACHGGDGRGRPGQAPPLVDSEWVNGPLDRLVRIVCDGVHGPITVNDEPWNLKMPGLGHNPLLNDERLAGVLTYVRRTWDNYGSVVEPDEVAAIRRQSAGRSTPWTAEELLDPTKHPAPGAAVDADPLAKYRPLLDAGDAERGRVLFHTNREIRCNACHKVGESGGGFVGPELTEVAKRGPREYLLESLIDPSAKIAKGFETVVIITEAGQIVTGTFVSDDGKQVTIAPPTGGKVTVAVADISERLTSPVSSMPPMGNAFKPEQIADLVVYLETLKGASPQAGAKP